MIDFSLIIGALPHVGGDSQATQRLVTAGGGFNVMSAARRQGLDALYLGQLGVGPFADVARGVLDQEGIAVATPARGELDVGVCIVLVDDSGERTFVTSPGAELTLTSDDLHAVDWGAGDVAYVSGYNVVYREVATLVSEWLSTLARDVLVVFDPGPRAQDIDSSILSRVLSRTDWLLTNASEAKLLSGVDDVKGMAEVLRERFTMSLVVVRDGERGCVGADATGTWLAPGFVSEVVDTNGAGDVHNGVLIAELCASTPLGPAMLRANAAAAISIASLGPATCPAPVDIDLLLQRQPRSVSAQ
jgi:sugar/nucleoside kinase (ribokinase family)